MAPKGNRYRCAYTDKQIDAMCEDLLNFAEKSRCAHFATWSRSKGKTHGWLYHLCESYPKLAEAFKEAKKLMAAKLVNNAVYKDDPNFNPQAALNYLPIYDQDFKDLIEWKAKISKQEEKDTVKEIHIVREK
jgi:hypothetical protein